MGLPGGVAEVEMIERARKRRLFEASLPEITEDPERWKRMMESHQMEVCCRAVGAPHPCAAQRRGFTVQRGRRYLEAHPLRCTEDA